jgi:ketosteroid isomerase-like protein
MKIRSVVALLGLAISMALPAIAETNTPDPQQREQLLALAKKFEDANNDAVALAALFTKDAVLVDDTGPISGRDAIEKHYKDLFENVHFSNNHTTYGPECPHAIGTDGKEMWENGAWSMTWQVKGGEPVNGKGFHSSIAVLEDGVWKKRMLTDNTTPAPAK